MAQCSIKMQHPPQSHTYLKPFILAFIAVTLSRVQWLIPTLVHESLNVLRRNLCFSDHVNEKTDPLTSRHRVNIFTQRGLLVPDPGVLHPRVKRR